VMWGRCQKVQIIVHFQAGRKGSKMIALSFERGTKGRQH
jgi:hypothetical protein